MKMSAIVLVLFSLLMAGCQTYSSLYGASPNQSATYVPESAIIIGEELPSDLEEEPQSEEAKKLAKELQDKIDQLANQEPSSESASDEIGAQPIAEESAEPVVEQTADPSSAIIVQETQLVLLELSASDPDGDPLTFAFTSPLDEKGEWQTTYGDAGEYTATITASDGDLATTQDILIIVNKKEESPVISLSSPDQSVVSLSETQAQLFEVAASDLNSDPLSFEWKLDGEFVSSEDSFTYQTTYDDSGSHTVKVDVTDGVSLVSQLWSVDVLNVNRLPVLSKIFAIEAQETDEIVIEAQASDADSDALSYSISDSRFTQADKVFTWQTGYDSAGTYTVTVTVTDGEDSVTQDVQVSIANVNRKPTIIQIGQKK
ncbi:MAG TPA: hypothetical protein VJB12_05570 [Candidatus Nanoarchaeia archaeon]|nr:hypothetical protein [Candidatus Nanoarchaeia archaeon]